ncbi:hypothetical protein [Desulfovibrio litoralis]|uniref:Uncharacterized protein n=1 Tax=Desulfovibrio litoralis DSM 11393 TaxID=1121455 RepID=A0A1M7T7S8_9BACT|nr:hypothetical protein [Desulfovibrio litoralis]SHN66779.1 hypothetical protein SAMN02745728_01691 [Desulfovibrio litoralis DSM 11393]
MNTEMLLVIASFSLQFLLAIVGTLLWHLFKKVESKVDALLEQRFTCNDNFASRESVNKLWDKVNQHDNAITTLIADYKHLNNDKT